jgi:hypothetical protein
MPSPRFVAQDISRLPALGANDIWTAQFVANSALFHSGKDAALLRAAIKATVEHVLINALVTKSPAYARYGEYPGDIAQGLIVDMLTACGRNKCDISAPVVGRIGDNKVMLSPPGGSDGRISFAYIMSNTTERRYLTGCFRGSESELLQQSDVLHGVGTKHNKHYTSFVAAAEAAFSRNYIPEMSKAIHTLCNLTPSVKPG